MTIRSYYKDTNLLKTTAKVVSIELLDEVYQVILDHTIFHPQGGGQPSDQGSIAGIPVVKAINNDIGEVVHLLPKNEVALVTLTPQQEVELLVNDNLRFKHAALHTAGHLIDLIISKTLCLNEKLINPQGNHFPDQAKIVYELVENTTLDLEQLKNDITQHMSEYIGNALPIHIFSHLSQGKRMIGIGDTEPVGCGGTHLPNTRYIDNFDIRQIKIKKNKLIVAYDCDCSIME
jgi:Ser-tRNA(Ala) deacylase AlaX